MRRFKPQEQYIYFNMKKFKVFVCIITVLCLFSCFAGCGENKSTNKNLTALKLKVTDLDGNAVSKAQITLVECGSSFFTDNNGLSPTMEVQISKTALNVNEDWSTVTVVVSCEGFVTTVLFNCVVKDNQTRGDLTIRLFKLDQSELPYVAIVEVPPDDFIKNLTGATDNAQSDPTE